MSNEHILYSIGFLVGCGGSITSVSIDHVEVEGRHIQLRALLRYVFQAAKPRAINELMNQ